MIKHIIFSYGQILKKNTRNNRFYILHEGLIATLDGDLIEEDYDDIKEKKFSRNVESWFGIGDKYWITSIVPPRGKIQNNF